MVQERLTTKLTEHFWVGRKRIQRRKNVLSDAHLYIKAEKNGWFYEWGVENATTPPPWDIAASDSGNTHKRMGKCNKYTVLHKEKKIKTCLVNNWFLIHQRFMKKEFFQEGGGGGMGEDPWVIQCPSVGWKEGLCSNSCRVLTTIRAFHFPLL